MVNASRFKYISREEQQGLGWIDLLARQYDPQTGRFTGVIRCQIQKGRKVSVPISIVTIIR